MRKNIGGSSCGKIESLKSSGETRTEASVRVYYQKRSVDYADYKMNLFYTSPLYIYVESEAAMSRWEKKKPRTLSE